MNDKNYLKKSIVKRLRSLKMKLFEFELQGINQAYFFFIFAGFVHFWFGTTCWYWSVWRTNQPIRWEHMVAVAESARVYHSKH